MDHNLQKFHQRLELVFWRETEDETNNHNQWLLDVGYVNEDRGLRKTHQSIIGTDIGYDVDLECEYY